MRFAPCFGLLLLAFQVTEVEPGKKFIALKNLFAGLRRSAVRLFTNKIPERRIVIGRRFAEAQRTASHSARLLHLHLHSHFPVINKRPQAEATGRKDTFLRAERFPARPIQRFLPVAKQASRETGDSISSVGLDLPEPVHTPTIQISQILEPVLTGQPSSLKHEKSEEQPDQGTDFLEDVFDEEWLPSSSISTDLHIHPLE